eukprot:gene15593-6863_t
MADREDKVFCAKLAEQAERYDEMVQAMEEVARSDTDLGIEERNLLSVAFKNVIGARRASWRIVSSLEQKEEEKKANKDEAKLEMMRSYRKEIEAELQKICKSILTLLDDHLIPNAEKMKSNDLPEFESQVFYRKM